MILDTILMQHESWLESDKHDLWVNEYNLRVARERENEADILSLSVLCERLRKDAQRHEYMIRFLKRNEARI